MLTEREERVLKTIREYKTALCSNDERGLLKMVLSKLEVEVLKP